MNSKYTVPELCKNVVIRERLLKELDDSAKKTFFISGGEGSGKTTLLCLYAKTKKNVFWYNADKNDNDEEFFFDSFIAYFNGDAENKNLDPYYVINSIENYEISIIIDNFETIKNEQIIAFFKDLVQFSDENVRIIFLSNKTLPDGLLGLCLTDDICILNSGDIVFSYYEVEKPFCIKDMQSFLESDGMPVILNPENEKTADDFFNDALGRLDDALKDFVIKTSFLFDVYAEICRFSTGEDNAEVFIKKAKGINEISRIIDGKLCYSYGFKRFCERNYTEIGFRTRRRAYDYCVQAGKIKDAVKYAASTRDFEKLSVVKNNIRAFFEDVNYGDAEMILSVLKGEEDIYCRIVEAICLSKLRENEKASVLIDDIVNNLMFVENRKDKAYILVLKALMSISEEEYTVACDVLDEARDVLKSYDSRLSVNIDAALIAAYILSVEKEKAKQLCSERISKTYINGEYEHNNIYKIYMCLLNLVDNNCESAERDIKSVSFEHITNISPAGNMIAYIAKLLFMKKCHKTAFDLLNNDDVLRLCSKDETNEIERTERLLKLKKHICDVSDGAAIDKEYISSLAAVPYGNLREMNRDRSLCWLIFSKLVDSIVSVDEIGIKKGFEYLAEYKKGEAGSDAKECISVSLALLTVMKKERIASQVIDDVFDSEVNISMLSEDVLPIVVYIRNKFNDEFTRFAERFVDCAVMNGGVLTYPIGYLNRPLLDYLDASKKFGGIIDELIKLTGVTKKAKIKTFGGIDIISDESGGEIKWRTAKTKELFAYFVHSGGAGIAKTDIVKDVFDVDDEKKATEIFNTTMYNLRKTVKKLFADNIFSLSKGKYSMKLDGIDVDVVEFRKSVEEFRKTGSISSALKITELYKGEYFKGLDAKWKKDAPAEYEECFCDAAEMILNNLKEENKTDLASRMCFVIWNEKCRSERMKAFLSEYTKQMEIKVN